ncbi:MAG: CoA transferase [Proteobacteria bacterium]|nr:CoA transferase [Pseudomonadota bacterium]
MTTVAAAGALAGIKVVDLARVLAGPYATMILADHGAEVIKVEPPQGDETRDWGPPFETQGGQRGDASYFLGVNRNKRTVALDVSAQAGREVLLRMLGEADVLVENFKTGTLEKWGLGYAEVLEPRFPRLVHCRISGFGADGPLGGMAGYDAVVQAMTGLMSVNGDASTGPLRLGTPVVDLATGLYSVIAILMALQERHRSGRGQSLDMTLHDCGMAMLHPQGANWLLGGKRPAPTGNAHSNLAPCDKYQTRTGEIFMAVGNDGQFRKLAAGLGRPELAADARFATNSERVRNAEALRAELQATFADLDGTAIAARLLGLGVPVGPVLPVDQATTTPHAAWRGTILEQDGYRGISTPIRLSRTPGCLRRRPPRFGEHSDEILREHGYSRAEIAVLRRDGITPPTRK